MYHAIRLTENQDLKQEIIKYSKEHKDYEIVSLMGTISKDDVHLHISLSDENGVTIGGHLKDGTIINSTCEIVILELPNYEFTREFDEHTGYNELVIRGK